MPFLAGDPLPADSLNAMGCTLRRAATQTLNDITTTTISWDTQDVDTDNLWSSGTTITIPETGLWAVTLSVLTAAVMTGRSFAQIVPSAGVFATFGGALRAGISTGESLVAVSAVIPLTATNTLTAQVFADMAANSTMTAAITVYRVVGGA